MIEEKIQYNTWSICPVCMERLPAERIKTGNKVFLQKTCKEHGTFKSIIWRGLYDMDEWTGKFDNPFEDEPSCPYGCGLCPDHLQKTCCVILEITNKCNLACSFCIANQDSCKKDPSLEEIQHSLFNLIEKNKTLLQLSGGEPTIREDLPEIIKTAKKAGAKYIQLNSNGIRLGEDSKYVRELAEAGLSFVFMQFDGTNDSIYENIRKKPLFEVKCRAIENCAEHNIGVTLVPTLVRGINTQNIGGILRFAITKTPKVRGVHFQPVSYTGRIEEIPTDNERITLDELVHAINMQTEGMIKPENLLPSCCDHPLCGFHGDFIINQGKIIPLLKQGNMQDKGCCTPNAADKNREFVARRWQRPSLNPGDNDSCCGDIRDMEYFLKRVKSHGFTITSMAFQDAGNIDFSRLRNCSLHVYDNGRMVPFCSYYLLGWKQ